MDDLRKRVADLVFDYPAKKASRGMTAGEAADEILDEVLKAVSGMLRDAGDRFLEKAKTPDETSHGFSFFDAADLVRVMKDQKS